MEMASPDLEKQGFFAVVFVNREYNGQPDPQGHAIMGVENVFLNIDNDLVFSLFNMSK
jgi:hypothetical protein